MRSRSGFEDILENAAAPERVHPLYALDGSIPGPEAVVDTLPGYAGSRPVRIGNAAQVRSSSMSLGPSARWSPKQSTNAVLHVT